MILEQELKGKTLSPQEVRSILKTDNKEIVELCKRASILPRKNSKGQTYFSYEEVKNLRKVQAMKGAAMPPAKTARRCAKSPLPQCQTGRSGSLPGRFLPKPSAQADGHTLYPTTGKRFRFPALKLNLMILPTLLWVLIMSVLLKMSFGDMIPALLTTMEHL